ncbi:hypothetical protein BJ138DRAFT_1163333 [Hygrophoropsis aurantiaca]|uniref:Uncharacterized protein n=1 Tax=Hygrophoropsis aurantiaca TaxID=72124 RepID=A0ACB7ZZJ0_9AGAM|nr:hypothetical protein BJ138DRAFT_1163333 [Hygrophoropsis aurantiaca]
MTEQTLLGIKMPKDSSSGVKTIEQEILELEHMEITLLDHIAQVRASLAQKRSKSQQAKNQLAPVCRLPNELILSCFEHFSSDEAFGACSQTLEPGISHLILNPAIIVSHVSHDWRQLFLKELLRRSGSNLIAVDLRYCFVSVPRYHLGLTKYKMQAFIEALKPVRHRLGALFGVHAQKIMIGLVSHTPASSPSHPSLGRFPGLSAFGALSHLTFAYPWMGTKQLQFSYSNCQEILAALPNIRSLKFDNSAPNVQLPRLAGDSSIPNDAPAFLPLLSSLAVVSIWEFHHVFALLSAPNLHRLELCGLVLRYTGLVARVFFVDGFPRFPTITEMALTPAYGAYPKAARSFFQAFPCLARVVIDGIDFVDIDAAASYVVNRTVSLD